jgi:hypothetical protein
MSFVAIAIGGSALIGGAVAISSGNKSAKAIETGANTAAASADKADATNRYIFDTTRADYAPWREVGANALGKLASMYGVQGPSSVSGAMSGTGTAAPQPYGGFETSPGYQFRVDEATKAIERSAAARGALRSGATMDALQRRVQGVATSEYENYANRLAALAGVGENANAGSASAGANYASGTQKVAQMTGNAAIAAGNARASAYANTGSAINQGVQGVAQAYLYNRGFGGGSSFDPYAHGYDFGPAG